MRSRIVVALVALLVPAALSFACGEAEEATGDRAYDWTVADWARDPGAPARVTILLAHPDSDVLAGRNSLVDTSRFRVHGRVYRSDGTPVDVWGIWDTWDNFQAEGGDFVVTGHVDGRTARLAVRSRLGTFAGNAGVVDPEELLKSTELCMCQPAGQGIRCVVCGGQSACCRPEPMTEIGLPVPGQAF